MHITVVFLNLEASLLNRLIDAAQTGVSRLGKMFITIRLPLKSLQLISLRSLSTSVKHGAFSPSMGRVPKVWHGLPDR
jgi:hypothetical protein